MVNGYWFLVTVGSEGLVHYCVDSRTALSRCLLSVLEKDVHWFWG